MSSVCFKAPHSPRLIQRSGPIASRNERNLAARAAVEDEEFSWGC